MREDVQAVIDEAGRDLIIHRDMKQPEASADYNPVTGNIEGESNPIAWNICGRVSPNYLKEVHPQVSGSPGSGGDLADEFVLLSAIDVERVGMDVPRMGDLVESVDDGKTRRTIFVEEKGFGGEVYAYRLHTQGVG